MFRHRDWSGGFGTRNETHSCWYSEDVGSQPVVTHDLRYGGSLARLQGQQVGQQLSGSGGVLGGDRRRHSAHYLQYQSRKSWGLKCPLECTHFVENTPNGPDI